MTGILALRDVRTALLGTALGSLVVADDLATRPVVTVTPRDDLHTALRRLTSLNLDEIPVVDPADPSRLVGLLGRKELVAVYTREIDALRARGHPPTASRARPLPGEPVRIQDEPDPSPGSASA